MSAFDPCHSRQKRCGRDDLKKSVLSRSVLGRVDESFPNGEFRTSICDQNYAPQKRPDQNVFFQPPHTSPFLMTIAQIDRSTKRTVSPIDPCQSRQKRRCRDQYTKITNLCFSPFFKWIVLCFVDFCFFLVGVMETDGRTLNKNADGH